jgi:uncharacterized membrane protein YoaK (UPF0700 family)
LQPRLRDALLLTLTAAAGSTDAVSFLALGRVFTANMTGNLVLLGIAVQGQLAGLRLWATSLACLVIGAAAGAAIFIAWRPSAPIVSVVLVAVIAAATISSRNRR